MAVFLLLYSLGRAQSLVKMEYFLDKEPGVGKGTAVSFSGPRDTILKTFQISAAGLQTGQHFVYVSPNINLVLSDTLPYYLYEEMYSTGKYPWFLSELDVLTLFKTTADAAGIRLVSNNATYEMLIAHLTRQTSDRYKVYRHVAAADMTKLIGPEFDIIGLRNVAYGAQDTTSKIMGSYLDEGLTSALISPSDRISTIESIYRKNQS